MKKQQKRILQVSICALLAVAVLSIMYLMTSKSPQNQTAIKTDSDRVSSAQAKAPKKA